MSRGGDRPGAGRHVHASTPRLLRPYRISARIDASARAGLVAYWRSRRLQDRRLTLSDCINEVLSAVGRPHVSVSSSRR